MDLILPVIGSMLAGALIGLEREFRGRPAGFRTHILVCLAAALLMLAAARQSEWDILFIPGESIVTDPTRMAHGVLTGIGFLCAGVIFREGFSVHGLTTAASLWIASAIGILFGVGLLELGAAATMVTVAVLAGLRVLDKHLPRRTGGSVVIRYRREAALSEEEVRKILSELRLEPSLVGHRLLDEGRVLEHSTRIRCAGPFRVDELSKRLAASPQVLEFEIRPHDD